MGDLVIDSSAILSLVFMENDADSILRAIEKNHRIFISAASYTETSIVFDRADYSYKKDSDLDRLIQSLSATIVDLTHNQARLARQAYKDFGKGSHHAKLNMGDCFSYALSKEMAIPLLYKGNDFAKTDIMSAL